LRDTCTLSETLLTIRTSFYARRVAVYHRLNFLFLFQIKLRLAH